MGAILKQIKADISRLINQLLSQRGKYRRIIVFYTVFWTIELFLNLSTSASCACRKDKWSSNGINAVDFNRLNKHLSPNRKSSLIIFTNLLRYIIKNTCLSHIFSPLTSYHHQTFKTWFDIGFVCINTILCYLFPSFPVVDRFCLFIYFWVLTFPLEYCSEFGNFVITFISINKRKQK